MSRQRLLQGNHDALCGIYALANFFQRVKEFKGYDETPGRLALQEALRAAEREKLLDSAHMMDGYEWPELARIARRVICDYYLDYSVEPIKVLNLNDASDLFKELSHITRAGGGAIIEHPPGDHWVFAYGVEMDSIKIKDSAPTSSGNALLSNAQQRRISLDEGLVFRKLLKKSK